MIKRRSITKCFNKGDLPALIDNFINEYLEKYNVIDIKEVVHNKVLLVTIIYEIELNDDSELLKKIVKSSENKDKISMNLLQEEFSIGFNRTSMALDTLEKLNIISPKPRKLLISYDEAVKIIDEYYK